MATMYLPSASIGRRAKSPLRYTKPVRTKVQGEVDNQLRVGKQPKFIAVDFFCGAGGTTCGLRNAGGHIVAGIDKDSGVSTTYTLNNRNTTLDRLPPAFLNFDIFPATEAYPSGQQEQLTDQLVTILGRAVGQAPDVPLLFAICAPCQPFTTLSRKEMTVDRQERRSRDRGLLFEAAEFVSIFEPDYVLSENVSGISDPSYGGVWQSFRDRLNQIGYNTGSAVVDAANFAVPQFRKRSIIIATRRKKSVSRALVVPLSSGARPWKSVSLALSHLPILGAGDHDPSVANHRTRGLSATNILRMRAAKPGESNAYLESTRFGDLSLPCHRRVNAKFKQRCFNDVYTRMHPDRPSPTITTKCHSISNGRFGHYDVMQNRGLSLREAAALQTFPDEYVFYPEDKIGVVAQMIGNAVPPRLAQYFANYLVSGAAERDATDLLLQSPE